MVRIKCHACDKRATEFSPCQPYSYEFPCAACARHGWPNAYPIPRVGPKMYAILTAIANNPGEPKLAAVQRAKCKSLGRGYESVDRLAGAGLVVNEGRRNCASLRITDTGFAVLALLDASPVGA